MCLEALEPRQLLAINLVNDINPATDAVATVNSLTNFNGTLYFVLLSKLWKSDGTVAGTAKIRDDVWDPSSMCVAGETMYFASGSQLWKTDGTAAGTAQVAPAIYPNPRNITAVGSRVFFRGGDSAGDELWTSDGTAAGTVRVKDINPGAATSDPRNLTSANGKLFFRAHDATGGDELWMSDGTDAGTLQVKDINPGTGSSEPVSLTNVNGTLFFVAHDANDSGYELWKSDGTPGGTVCVKDIRPGKPGSSPTSLRNVGGTLMFVATDGASGYEIWKSDGTDAGTVMVKDLMPGAGSAQIDQLTAVGSTLYFSADDASGVGIELWKTDGTAAGTARVKDINPGAAPSNPGAMVAMGGKLYFIASSGSYFDLFVSDGTAAGTHEVQANVRYWNAAPVAVGDKVFFNAAWGARNTLWVSDGTSGSGTHEVAVNMYQAAGSNIGPITKIGSTLYFSANDGTNGQELWKSDGTEAGTSMVADLAAGAGGSNPTDLVNLGGTLYFAASGKLYKTDGTVAGTVAVSSTVMSPTKLKVVGSTIYFAGSDVAGQELWKSNGTDAGTMRVADVRAGGGSSSPDSLTDVNGTLYFVADDGSHGQELFKTDGTAAGTMLVKDIRTGVNVTSAPTLLTAVGSTLFFRASDGSNGYELWKSDGTPAGTAMVKDIRAGADGSAVHLLAAVGSNVYFVADDGVHGQEVWKSDGTNVGTVLVRDIVPGSHGSTPTNLTELNGKLIFRADDEISGGEPWISDGTSAGTTLLKDLFPGATTSDAMWFTNTGSRVVFVAYDGASPYQPWVTDGTSAGTLPTGLPGDQSPPRTVVEMGGSLYFSTSQYFSGDELRRMSIPTGPGAVMAGSPPAIAVPTSAPSAISTTSPTAISTGPDIFYDGTWRSSKPSIIGSTGFAPATVVGGGLYTDWTIDLPDEARVRALARQAYAAGTPLVLDIEHWQVDSRTVNEATVAWSLERLMQVVDWAHDERPGLRVGLFGLMPIDNYPAPSQSSGFYTSWHAATMRILPLINKVDELYSGMYPSTPQSMPVWRSSGEAMIAEAQTFGKPVRPFIWMQFLGFNPDGAGRFVPPDAWRMMLDTSKDLADGAMIWDGGGAWDDDAPWWTVTRDFLIDSTPVRPVAGSALRKTAGNATQTSLAWNDTAYNETGWRVERRVGNGAYVAMATLGANVTSYTDASVSAASDYTYRVVAFNAGGDSASNELAIRTPDANIAPAAPPSASATLEYGAPIRLSWLPGSQNETGFKIERSAGGGTFTQIATTAAGVTTYVDSSVLPDVSYVYRVRANNAFGDSAYATAAAITLATSSKDPRGHWRLDDGTGLTAGDSSIGNHAGTLANGPTWTSGTLGGALSFDDVDDRVIVNDAGDLRFTASQDFTLTAWVNLTALPGKRVAIVSKSHASGNWFSIGIDATNHWIFSGPAGDLVGPLATIGWTHVAGVQDGTAGTRKLYINGTPAAGGLAQAADGTGNLWIGGAEGTNEFFAGTIDDVRLFGRTWTDAELDALAHPRFTLSGTAGNDAYNVSIDVVTNQYRVTRNGVTVLNVPREAVASLSIIGDTNDDSLTLDFTGGDPLPAYGFDFTGGSGAGRDTLSVIGVRPGVVVSADATHLWRGVGWISYSNVEAFSVANGTLNATGSLAADVTIDSGGAVTFGAAQNIGSLTLNAGAQASVATGGGSTLVLGSLSIATGASLDLADNAIVMNYPSASPLGGWNGSAYTGITGMIGAGTLMTSSRTLRAVEASQYLGLGNGQTASWHGQTVDSTTVLVFDTWGGDLNLDGVINGDDYFVIDSNFPVGGHGFANGDLDLNGRIDADDYFLIDSTFARSQASPANAPAAALSAPATNFFMPASIFSDAPVDSAYDRLLGEPAASLV